MVVRNFFTKAVAEHTGCFAFFNGSVLGVEAYFRASFAGNNFYLEIEDGMWSKPYIRVKCFPSNSGLFLLEVEIYNPESKLYEQMLYISDKDRAFLRHITSTCSTVLNKAAMEWRDKLAKMEDPEFEEIPF